MGDSKRLQQKLSELSKRGLTTTEAPIPVVRPDARPRASKGSNKPAHVDLYPPLPPHEPFKYNLNLHPGGQPQPPRPLTSKLYHWRRGTVFSTATAARTKLLSGPDPPPPPPKKKNATNPCPRRRIRLSWCSDRQRRLHCSRNKVLSCHFPTSETVPPSFVQTLRSIGTLLQNCGLSSPMCVRVPEPYSSCASRPHRQQTGTWIVVCDEQGPLEGRRPPADANVYVRITAHDS